MREETIYGSIIYKDGTIEVRKLYYCEDEEEFWTVYDALEGQGRGYLKNFSISTSRFITVEEYRNRIGEEEE